MLAFGDDFASPFLNLLWAAIALLAGWSIGSRFGHPAAGTAAIALVLSTPMMLTQTGNAPNDAMGLALLLAAIALALESASGLRRVNPSPSLLISGLTAGLAAGTKLTFLLPVVLFGAGMIPLSVEGHRLCAAFFWFGPAALTGGFWYLRNLVLAGNPLPWLRLGPLSGPDQLDIYPRPAHSLAEYLLRPADWLSQVIPGVGDAFGFAAPILALLCLAGLAVFLLPRGKPLLTVLAWTATAMLIAHLLLPISASGPLGFPVGLASHLRYVGAPLAIGRLCLNALGGGNWQLPVSALFVLGLAANPADSIPTRLGAWLLALVLAVLAE